ncbi:HAD-superfamily hydrolase, subfamily IIA [Rhodobacterales bacterium HTCC2255]|nr:HAD-superfamily hydrolase, subfamily IIA [Rhodobacterales bacterium HTCC2255]
MTTHIKSLKTIASNYDAIVFDQWGVLHNGSAPYKNAVGLLKELYKDGTRLAVLSNSGKRSELNAKRISEMGFSKKLFEQIMTSGEALWNDISTKVITEKCFFPIERNKGDASNWVGDLSIKITYNLNLADAIILMGLPDEPQNDDWKNLIKKALVKKLPLYCSNPDLMSPRADGKIVTSPGTIANYYENNGGKVFFYGKPHRPIFDALQLKLGVNNILMVGDSLKHDIQGAQSIGWDSLFVLNGLYSTDFRNGEIDMTLNKLITENDCQRPTYLIEELQ